MFNYSAGAGNDTIFGFDSTSTTLSIAGTKYSTKKSGDNVIVTVDKGKIILTGAANLSSVNIDFNKLLTVTDKTKSPVTVDSKTKIIDASARTKAVKITGNALTNSILGGKGNDTLTGGKGNDSLWGNGGKDTFIYASGDGKDIIYGFDNNDMLQITGAFSGTYSKKNKEVAFKVGSTTSAITLKDFSATSFNVNGTDYKISGSKLVKK